MNVTLRCWGHPLWTSKVIFEGLKGSPSCVGRPTPFRPSTSSHQRVLCNLYDIYFTTIQYAQLIHCNSSILVLMNRRCNDPWN